MSVLYEILYDDGMLASGRLHGSTKSTRTKQNEFVSQRVIQSCTQSLLARRTDVRQHVRRLNQTFSVMRKLKLERQEGHVLLCRFTALAKQEIQGFVAKQKQ
jgi:hypothetical protein